MQSLAVNKFLGLHTRLYRGNRPPGALDDVKNFVLNSKMGKLVQRTGYTTDLNGNIKDVSGATTVSSFDRIFMPSTENPESKDFYVIAGKASSTPKFFQRPFYWYSGTATNSWLDWNEQFSGNISGKSTATFVITGAGQTDDYYKGWCVFNEIRGLYFIVTGYNHTTETFTIMPNVPSDWANGDTVQMFRGFHDNPAQAGNANGMTPTWTNPCVLKQGDNIVASGGQSSNLGCRPIWSGYVNQTFFSGSTPFTFQGTYVTEAEIKNYIGLTVLGSSESSADALPAAYYSLAHSFQTVDGQRGPLVRDSETNITAGNDLKVSATVYIGTLNKRIRYINLYVATNPSSTATPAWSTYFYVGQIDLQGANWVFTQTATTVPGFHTFVFPVLNAVWNSRGSDGATHVGFTEAPSYTCSFSLGVITAGKLFVGLIYDYGVGAYDYDSIRYSPINGAGASSYNVLANIPGFTQSTIDVGDPNRLSGLSANEAFLFVAKTRGVYYIDTTADPVTWSLVNISKDLGCNATLTLHVTPFGIVWANGGDDVYLWRGGKPDSLMKNFLVDFRAIATTYASQWVGWYDPLTKCSRFMITTDGSTLTTVYEIEYELPVPSAVLEAQAQSFSSLDSFALVKHITADKIASVARRSDGVVFFSTGTNQTFYWDINSNSDAGTVIGGYFKMTGIVVTEKDFIALLQWYIGMEPSGATANSLDVSVYLDDNVVQALTGLTATKTYLRSGVPPMGATYSNLGRKLGIAFNVNATRATWATSLIINEVGFDIDTREVVGDLQQSL